jgi:hypothetical protein
VDREVVDDARSAVLFESLFFENRAHQITPYCVFESCPPER